MNSTKETWDDILQQCRTWIQVTVAKFWYYTFNNSALQRRSQGKILPQRGFFYRENTCPVKHCTFLETCICPGCILKGKKSMQISGSENILIMAKQSIMPVTPHLSAHCCQFYCEQSSHSTPPPSHNAENIWTHTFDTALTNPLV